MRSKFGPFKTNNHDGQTSIRFAHHGNYKQNHEFDGAMLFRAVKIETKTHFEAIKVKGKRIQVPKQKR